MADLAKILEDALSLETRDRAVLAEKLLASLEELPDNETQTAWFREAERRREGLERGHHRAVPSAEVHARANQLLE